MVRRARPSLVIGLAMILLVVAAGCQTIDVTQSEAVSPPDPSATGFGDAFDMDEDRIVARAEVDGSPVVYVFDRTPTGWTHSATLTPGPGATEHWGDAVAVSGDTIAIADPGTYTDLDNYGTVFIHDLQGGTWTQTQALRRTGSFQDFAEGVWLSGDTLIVGAGPQCDSLCGVGAWRAYQRSGGPFQDVAPQGHRGLELSVGVDHGRVAVGVPGGDAPNTESWPNALTVLDGAAAPPAVLVDEVVEYGDYEDPPPPQLSDGWFRRVDLAGELMAYESCCSTDSALHIRRDTGSGYRPEATFPVTAPSAGISVLPDAVLVADASSGTWHSYIIGSDGWQHGPEVPAPDAVAAAFDVAPVAVGHQVAVRGDGKLWVLTLESRSLGGR